MSIDHKYYKLVRDNIRKLVPYSSARHEFSGQALVQLDANENPYEYHMYNRYPDPLQASLKKKLARLKGVPEESVFIGNGSDEAIDIIIRIFCSPGMDGIHILEPTYGMYRVAADINDVEVHSTLLTDRFEIDKDLLLDNIRDNDRVLWICSPNNPTGNIMDQHTIIDILRRFDGIVVIDEAYIDFSVEISMVSILEEHPNLIVIQTFSKAWGLAGLRCGMAFAAPWIIRLMNSVKPPYNVNAFTQNYIAGQLDEVDSVRREVSKLIQERHRVFEFLKSIDSVSDVFPTDANFILFRIENSHEIFTALQQNGVIIRNRNNDPLCKGCLRVTIGTESENDLFIKQMKILTK